ncbi:hypothetical protein GCM10009422_29030 [Brevundimonas kwangchunensis]|uniref:Uncharacterized protein n=1 Tax=Brevundimonas kwangchunensis TaxID=322163 RepID=A0ABN1H610_9CAUL
MVVLAAVMIRAIADAVVDYQQQVNRIDMQATGGTAVAAPEK